MSMDMFNSKLLVDQRVMVNERVILPWGYIGSKKWVNGDESLGSNGQMEATFNK